MRKPDEAEIRAEIQRWRMEAVEMTRRKRPIDAAAAAIVASALAWTVGDLPSPTTRLKLR
jgi:hypothetical protein